MTSETDKAAVKTVLDAVAHGLRERDAAAVGAQFSSDCVTYDLAPPLAHGLDVAGLAAWMESWQGPIGLEWRDLRIVAGDRVAFCYGLNRMTATTKDGETAEWWQRATVCLTKVEGAWKIVNEHTSVPFYMDGSYKAAIDLQP